MSSKQKKSVITFYLAVLFGVVTTYQCLKIEVSGVNSEFEYLIVMIFGAISCLMFWNPDFHRLDKKSYLQEKIIYDKQHHKIWAKTYLINSLLIIVSSIIAGKIYGIKEVLIVNLYAIYLLKLSWDNYKNIYLLTN